MFKGQSPTVNLHVFSQGCDEAQLHAGLSATICALILTTAHVTPQKSADSPRKNGRIFRITPTPRQPSCRRSWRTFPLCRQLPYNKSQTLANHSPAFSSARKARCAVAFADVILRCLPTTPAFRILNTVPEHKYSQGVESQCSVTTFKNTASKKAGARKSSQCAERRAPDDLEMGARHLSARCGYADPAFRSARRFP